MSFRYFDLSEFKCSETGKNAIRPKFVYALDELRGVCGFSFVITSGYRSKDHSIEKKKAQPGVHTEGIAADIKVADGVQRRAIVENALELGFGGIGVAKDFIHVDLRDTTPVIWTY
jgi:uncharacterized protein YcbK (DUF882 family)